MFLFIGLSFKKSPSQWGGLYFMDLRYIFLSKEIFIFVESRQIPLNKEVFALLG
jgi:hypothetical protein